MREAVGRGVAELTGGAGDAAIEPTDPGGPVSSRRFGAVKHAYEAAPAPDAVDDRVDKNGATQTPDGVRSHGSMKPPAAAACGIDQPK
jgi:hypothetical protein